MQHRFQCSKLHAWNIAIQLSVKNSNVLFLLKSPCISVSVRSGSHDLAKLATVLLSDKECDVKLKILEDLILTKCIK